MTINFPKFPNDRRDKNRPIDPNRAVISPLNVPSVDNTLPTGDNPAHNRSHHDMLTQTDQLQSETDTLTEAQRNLLKKHLKPQTAPTKNTKSLPLMPILLGLILLASGGVMGYMYQAYTQPPATSATIPVSAKATPVANPITPQVATTPVSGVAGNSLPMPITTSPASAVPAPAITVVNNPASPPPAALLPPINTDGNPNTYGNGNNNSNSNSNNNNNNNAPANIPNPVAAAKPAPADTMTPVNTKPIEAQPVSSPEANAPAKPTESPTKNTKSYDDFIKSSENTLFIEPPPHKQ